MKHKNGCCLFSYRIYHSLIFRFFVFVFCVFIPFQLILVYIIERLRPYFNGQPSGASAQKTLVPMSVDASEEVNKTSVTVPAPSAHDDLKGITGIGKKTQDILYENGITSFAQLAKMKVETINLILETTGSRVKADQSWIDQARQKL